MQLNQVIEALKQTAVRTIVDFPPERLLQERKSRERHHQLRDRASLLHTLTFPCLLLGQVARKVLVRRVLLLPSIIDILFSVEYKLHMDRSEVRNLHCEFLRHHHRQL